MHLPELGSGHGRKSERIRALVTQLVPDTEETMSYGMPTLTYKNRAPTGNKPLTSTIVVIGRDNCAPGYVL
jgi:hypothetical protein